MKSQNIALLMLLMVVAFLAFELLSRRSNDSKKDKKEVVAKKDTLKAKSKMSVADSIALTYASTVFRDEQVKFPRVKSAYKEKAKFIKKLYKSKKIDETKINLYLRAFKEEETVEVWAKNKEDKKYKLLHTYKFCKNSGTLGPKRREGDEQIPEGFYRIDKFNPNSSFYLSLGINYPNRSDKVLGDTTNLGGEIFIHGDCITTGCIPITDDKIKELYVMATDAKAAGQKRIPVTIFPNRLTDENFTKLITEYSDNPDLIRLWTSLKQGYQFFQDCKKLPEITFNEDGTYSCKTSCK